MPHLEEFAEIVRVDGHVIELVGATGTGLTSDGEENEAGSGFSLLALNAPKASFRVVPSVSTWWRNPPEPEFWRKRSGVENPGSWIVLTNPFVFDNETWMKEWSEAWPGVASMGGLASGSEEGDGVTVFYNGREIDAVAVSVED